MKIIYDRYVPRGTNRDLLVKLIGIVDDYAEQGLKLTLRQLYYQCVTKNLINNTENEYKRVGEIVSKARLGGVLDWDAVEDRVRVPRRASEFDSIDDLVEAALSAYRLPRLKGQDTYVELWVEKDALAGVLLPIAVDYHVTLMVNRGYSSTTAMKEAGDRIRARCVELGCDDAVVLYIGDHDPSGEDMVRDIAERLEKFVNGGWIVDWPPGAKPTCETAEDREERLTPISVGVRKLALTMKQVRLFNPPKNPAKLSDSRTPKYIKKFGVSSWEVDALPPQELKRIIERSLDKLIDDNLVEKIRKQEEKDKKKLKAALKPKRRSRSSKARSRSSITRRTKSSGRKAKA